MQHNIKIAKCFADVVYSGEKTFEVRKNDRGYQKGDTVLFEVVDNTPYAVINLTHPLNGVEFEITYVLHEWGLEDEFVAFSIKRKED